MEIESEQIFFQTVYTMASKFMRRCSTLLIIREMQIKTTRYQLTSVEMAIIKQMRENKCWQDVEKRETLYTVGQTVNWYSHYRKLQRFFEKLKITNTSNAISEYILKGNKNRISKRYMHSHGHYSTICTNQDMETTCVHHYINE